MKTSKRINFSQFNILQLIILLCSLIGTSYAQDNQTGMIKLKSGYTSGEDIDLKAVSDEHRYNDMVYAILQFEKDSVVAKDFIQEMGIQLNEYIPDNSYWAAIPDHIDTEQLYEFYLQGIYLPTIEDRISTTIINLDLQNPVDSAGNIDIVIETHKQIDKSVLDNLSYLEIDYENQKIQNDQMTVASISINDILELLSFAYIKYIDVLDADSLLANTRAKSVGAEYVQHPDFGGLSGQGIHIALHDRNARHIDLRDRVINYNNYSESTHANMCAGMIGGMAILAGSKHRGIAPASTIHMSYDRSSNFYQSKTSASTVSGSLGSFGYYNNNSVSYDQHMIDVPEFIHAVSAGNSGMQTTSGFNTVLSGWQSAKNVLSVGAMNYHQDTVWIQSSRGPTVDGRIKPDIVAIGFGMYSQNKNNGYIGGGGTSFSGPQVAAGAGLISEHFQQLHNGEKPIGSLIKSILCNSATDKGNPGPDYKYGFGKMNLITAKQLLDNGQFATGTIADRDLTVFDVTAPADLDQLKIMLNWTDVPGSTTAALSLVNDLNIIVVAPDGSYHYPLILDPLNPSQPAIETNAVWDHLNNVEQVVISDPMPGVYQLVVHAYNINVSTGSSATITGPGIDNVTYIPTYGGTESQEYSLSYQFIEKGIQLIGPIKDETVKGNGPSHYIEWNYNGPTVPFTIEYTFDDGNTWQTLDDNVDSDLRIYPWSPSYLKHINTDQARIRITANGTPYSSMNSAPFKIYDILKGLKVNTYCEDIVQLNWNPTLDAIHYKVTQYNGVDAMATLFTTSNTSALVSCDFSQPDLWFAVQPVFASSGIWGDQDGVRSAAVKFTVPVTPQVCGCEITNYSALRDLYLDTDGDNWSNRTGWPTAADFANNPIPNAQVDLDSWYGVTLNADGCVSNLMLTANNLVGTIPTSIGQLAALETLSLRQNSISGTIPLEIGDLTQLTNIWLDYNQLIGSIPSTVGNLTLLKSIDFDFNNLSGGIPSTIGNLVNLVHLAFDSNQLTGPIPSSIGSLLNLKYLYLKYNAIQGVVPASLGNLSELIILSIHDNQLTGTIPTSLGNLNKLKNLMLHDNQLTGSIPSELGNLSSVVNLRVNENQLTGTIPGKLSQLSALKVFTTNDNHLSGCYDADLIALCARINTSSNAHISAGNMFDEPWETFCASGGTSGVCPLQPLGNHCTETVSLTGTIASGVYKAEESIEASGLISDGNTVFMGADTSVTLESGFEVESNAVFEATLEGCE